MTAITDQVTVDGEKIRSIRVPGGTPRWTQEELARSVGISRSYIAEIERGRRRPRITVAKALAKALGVPLQDIVK